MLCSVGLCGRTDCCNPPGDNCHLSVAEAQAVLAQQPGLDHPPVCDAPNPRTAPLILTARVSDTSLSCALEQPGPVSLKRAGDGAGHRPCKSMLHSHHEPGWNRFPRNRMPIRNCPRHQGISGDIGLGSAHFRLQVLDVLVGWSGNARADKIQPMLCKHCSATPYLLASSITVVWQSPIPPQAGCLLALQGAFPGSQPGTVATATVGQQQPADRFLCSVS